MFRSGWLHSLLDMARSRKSHRQHGARQRRRGRLMLESLEDRVTPAQTVGSYTDLVKAIAADTAANTNYDIQITQDFTFDAGGQVAISKLGAGSTLTIEGQNGNNFTLTGNGNRLFTIAKGQFSVAFKNLTLTGGTVANTKGSAAGGAVLDQGANITLSGANIQGNTVTAGGAQSKAMGGGVFVSGGGGLTVQDGSTIAGNTATTNGDKSKAMGGGVFVSGGGNLTVQDGSSINYNKALSTQNGKGFQGNSSYGGGVYMKGGNVTISKATVHQNEAIGNSGAGGGVYLSGTGKVTVKSNSTIDYNDATGSEGGLTPTSGGFSVGKGSGSGGGVYINSGALTVSDSTFHNNSAQGTNGPYADGNGGGVYVKGASTVQISNGTFSYNHAQGGPGAKNPKGAVQFGFGPGSGWGGGVYLTGAGTMQITNSNLSNNSAQGGLGANATASNQFGSSGGYGSGGGLYVGGSGWTVKLIADTLSNNSAVGGGGGNGMAGTESGSGGDGGNGYGGGAWVGGSGTLTILNGANPSRWVGNFAQGGTGGKGDGRFDGGRGGQGQGGALFTNTIKTLTVNIGNTTFYANKAIGADGGAGGKTGQDGVGNSGSGGAILVQSSNVTMVNSTLGKNSATGGNGQHQGSGFGGGILFTTGSTVLLDNNTITQNTVSGANNDGAAVDATGTRGNVNMGTRTLINNLIQGNKSIGSAANDLDAIEGSLTTAINNFIVTISANAVSAKTNIIGNPQMQLGNVVGVDGDSNLTGGPIYYPLQAGVVSVGAGNTNVLNAIANIEGTAVAKTTDEVGNARSRTNPPNPPPNGSIDLGAVQSTGGGGGGGGGGSNNGGSGGKGGGQTRMTGGGGCTCAASSATAAKQMLQNLNTYLLNIDLQIYLSGLAAINTLWTQLTGKLPPGTPGSQLKEGDPLEQLYDQMITTYFNLFTSILPLPPPAQEPAITPEAFGATGGGESFAAPSSAVPD